MNTGTFYGISVGPGDPELLTVKAVAVLSKCDHVFVPKSEMGRDSMALDIARRYIKRDAQIRQLLFPMTTDETVLSNSWAQASSQVLDALKQGDACFLTLGDSLLYSTYIYLLRELESACPDLKAVTIPGITSFAAAAALTNFPLGEGKRPVRIVPVSDDMETVRGALDDGGTVVLMKVGRRLADVVCLLEETGLIGCAVFVARAGQEGERIETDLRKLKSCGDKAGYLSLILVHADKKECVETAVSEPRP